MSKREDYKQEDSKYPLIQSKLNLDNNTEDDMLKDVEEIEIEEAN
jgi:hypothetical protein